MARRNATESRPFRWLGRSSILPVAAQNPLKHSLPRNRSDAANGGSCLPPSARRPVDRQSETVSRHLKYAGAQQFRSPTGSMGEVIRHGVPLLAIVAGVWSWRGQAGSLVTGKVGPPSLVEVLDGGPGGG